MIGRGRGRGIGVVCPGLGRCMVWAVTVGVYHERRGVRRLGLIIFVSGFLLRGCGFTVFFSLLSLYDVSELYPCYPVFTLWELALLKLSRPGTSHRIRMHPLTPAISDTHTYRNDIFHPHLSVYPFSPPPPFSNTPPPSFPTMHFLFLRPKKKSQTQILNTPSQMQHTQTPALIPSPIKERKIPVRRKQNGCHSSGGRRRECMSMNGLKRVVVERR